MDMVTELLFLAFLWWFIDIVSGDGMDGKKMNSSPTPKPRRTAETGPGLSSYPPS